MKISLEKFVESTKGTKVSVPWNEQLTGQCVSLVQQYIGQCLEQPMKARGNAKDWIQSYVAEGLGTIVSEPRKGDILVYGSSMGGGYGHIAIYISENKMYDQNNLTHDNLCAGYSKIFNGYTILRPNVELVEDVQTIIEQPNNTYLNLSKDTDSWSVYPMNVKPIKKNRCGALAPSQFGGLTYTIQGYTMPNVAIINTQTYGQVQIYIGSELSDLFSITNQPNKQISG